jgi:hypothetical protein
MEFEAPEYHPSVVETFKRDVIENADFNEQVKKGIVPIYAAFDNDKIIALIGMRKSKHKRINIKFFTLRYSFLLKTWL